MMPRDLQESEPAMDCEEVKDLLHAFVTDELEDDEVRPILRHLAECTPCRGVMAEHVKLVGVLRANMPPLVKPYFTKQFGSWN